MTDGWIEAAVVRASGGLVTVDAAAPSRSAWRRRSSRAADDLLVLHGIRKRWGKSPVLEGVDLSVARGALVSISGANGTGKTTLLRIAAGLIHPDSGEVALDGLHPERDRRAFLGRLGFLSAGDRTLYARLSPRRHLDLGARLALLPAGEPRQQRSSGRSASSRWTTSPTGGSTGSRWDSDSGSGWR